MLQKVFYSKPRKKKLHGTQHQVTYENMIKNGCLIKELKIDLFTCSVLILHVLKHHCPIHRKLGQLV